MLNVLLTSLIHFNRRRSNIQKTLLGIKMKNINKKILNLGNELGIVIKERCRVCEPLVVFRRIL